MMLPYLTKAARPAHKLPMAGKRRAIAGVVAMLGSTMAGGCITVNAPAEPIVIELNVNITQEVIYRLADDVRQNIDENPDIF
jgi:hypothetical protein